MKTTLILLFTFFSLLNLQSQTIPEVRTTHSRLNNGKIGKENIKFRMSNNTLYITDIDYGSTVEYGPVKVIKNGYDDEGFYIIQFMPDFSIEGATKKFLKLGMKVYQFTFNEKSGNVLFVHEVDKNRNTNQYYTDQGFELSNSRASNEKKSP